MNDYHTVLTILVHLADWSISGVLVIHWTQYWMTFPQDDRGFGEEPM